MTGLDRGAVERTGSAFDASKLLKARKETRAIIRSLARSIIPGMLEEEAVRRMKQMLKERKMLRGWHGVHVRFGTNTLKRFGEPSEPGVLLRENDIFFIDIGPVFEGYEGDGGDTFVVGNDPDMWRARQDVRSVFAATRRAWIEERLTGERLYEVAQREAQHRGWELNLDMSGHRLANFPHAVHFSGGLIDIDFTPAPAHWVLEIQIARTGTPYSAFYEDLLLESASPRAVASAMPVEVAPAQPQWR